MQNLIDLSRKLASGKLKSRSLVEDCLARIDEPAGEGARAFLTVYRERALAEADRWDEARQKGWGVPRFAGVPISIKDLFDVAGERTRAGSRVLDEDPPARADATAIERLRRAGFVIVGKTNMTEFAYSGLGINNHFGTPSSPFDRKTGRIPGGSTSGGAVSVADGMAAATIGTDTGGSCRIPAAFCGIVGFRPTPVRVPRAGVVPLSKTVNSVGPLATSVSCCAVLNSILSGGDGADEESFREIGLRLGVVENYVTAHIEPEVAHAWEAALSRLSRRGVSLTPLSLPELEELPTINAKGGVIGAEAYAWHRRRLETRGAIYDPWIRGRIEVGGGQSAADYIDVQEARARIIESVGRRTRVFDAVVMPTVQIAPPELAPLQDDALAMKVNALCLRNTAIANFLDRPAISMPCHAPDSAPVGFMLMGETGGDRRLLSVARGIEYIVRMR